MRIGFTVVRRGDEVEFHISDHGVPDRPALVSFSRDADCWAVLVGRLRYRSDLLALLGSAEPANHAGLAAAAYRHWGEEGLGRLEGDYALVIWDLRRDLFIGTRDPMGGYPLFWTRTSDLFAFGNRLHILWKLARGPALDLDHAAHFLMLPRASSNELPIENTAYSHINRVLPGAFVSYCPPTQRLERRSYWNWLERLVEPRTDREDEISRRYGSLLGDAVRERIDGPTGAHFSGGMDSTAVALIARNLIEAGGDGAKLPVFSLLFDHYRDLADEVALLEDVLRQERGLVAHRIPAGDMVAFRIFFDPPPHAEPWPWLSWSETDFALEDAAMRAGLATLLTGHGADEMVAVPPYYLADLLGRGRVFAARAEALRWAGALGRNWWSILRRYGMALLLPVWLQPGLGALFHGGFAPWAKMNHFTIPPWIRRGFARRYDLRGRALENIRRIYSACRPFGLSLALAAIANRTGASTRWYHAAPGGLSTAHPFLDPRLLCHCLGFRARFQPSPEKEKAVLAEAVRDVLPRNILERRRKGHFNEPVFRGLAQALPRLEALIRTSPLDGMGILDTTALVECLHAAALGIGGDAAIISRLHLTLSFVLWLSKQEEWLRDEEPPALIVRASISGQP